MEQRPRWVCPAGEIIGLRDGGVDRALGIPYARAKRNGRPVDVKGSPETVVEAVTPSPACPQIRKSSHPGAWPGMLEGLEFSEDCQNLSVTVPRGGSGNQSPMPVVVWIHGGSFVSGAGDSPLYDPRLWAEEQGIIIVSITYRLGLFGLLGGPMRNGKPSGRTPNLALLDVKSALRWVKRNIASFGGDTDNITLFGESVGADMVAALMVSEGVTVSGPNAQFHRAIMDSWPGGAMFRRDAMYEAMLEIAAEIPLDASTEEILGWEPSVRAAASHYRRTSIIPLGLQWGQYPLPPESQAAVALGRAAKHVDLLIGWNRREMAFAALSMRGLRRMISFAAARYIVDAKIRAKYEPKIYHKPINEFSDRYRERGGKIINFQMNWGPRGNPWAAGHTAELPLLFPTRHMAENSVLLKGSTYAEVVEKGRALRHTWAEFARHGARGHFEHPPEDVLELYFDGEHPDEV